MSTTRKLCYPHPRGANSHVLDYGDKPGLHPTEGLAHNWALDFMAPGDTPALAVEAGTLWKFSGHDPATGVHHGDVFGWSVYLHTRDGLIYYYTHLGERFGAIGMKVPKGAIIGRVGHWPGDPGRSHTHLGVTFPYGGDQASKRAILNVAAAPRVKGVVIPEP